MEFSLNAEEILSILEEIKLNGIAFYRHLARSVKKKDVRDALIKVSEMEERHLVCFSKMRSDLSEYDRANTVFHRDSDEWMYLRNLAGRHVFDVGRDPCDVLSGDETAEDITMLAMEKEKDLMIFLLELKHQVLGRDRHGSIDRIVREEMMHLAGFKCLMIN